MRAVAVLSVAVGQRLRWFTLTPFDQSTAAGRADERHRRVALSAAASVVSKILGLLATLVSIPLALNYLGPERFGIWATLSSLVISLQFADLGIGNGVITAVSVAHGRGDRVAVRRTLSSGLFALSAIALLILLVTPAAVGWVPWGDVFKLTGALARNEVAWAVGAFLLCIALAIPLALVQRVQIGLQLGFFASLWQCASNLLCLVCIWLATRFELGLPWLVLALLAAPLLAALFNAAVFFSGVGRDIRPQARLVCRTTVRSLMAAGGAFLVLQVGFAVVLYSDSIVIASVLGATHVAEYAVPEKLFHIVSVVLATVLMPLWPAYGEAVARGDVSWVTRTLKRSLAFAAIVSGAAAAVLVPLAPWVIRHWVGSSVQVSTTLLAAMALWKLAESVGLALSMFLNGAGIMRFQVVTACTTVGGVLLLKSWLVREWGVPGAPLTTVLTYVPLTLIPALLLLPGIIRRIKARQATSSAPHGPTADVPAG